MFEDANQFAANQRHALTGQFTIARDLAQVCSIAARLELAAALPLFDAYYAIANAVERILDDAPYRSAMVQRFRGLRESLGEGEGSARVAELARGLLA